tara:strand:- start:249 stop:449 length:201 start_codon:yes stop_codon:yes gene_type:complete
MTKAQINAEYKFANERAAHFEQALREVDVVYRAECRADVRSSFLSRSREWVNRAADCIVAYRAAAA